MVRDAKIEEMLCGDCSDVAKMTWGRGLSTCRRYGDVLHDERTECERRCPKCVERGRPKESICRDGKDT